MENTETQKEFSHEVDTLVEFLSFPLDSTDEIFEKFKSLPGAKVAGAGKNKFCFVPGHRDNKVVLVAHADTVWNKGYARKVKAGTAGFFKVEGGRIVSTHPTAGLGADDRAGLAILWLLKSLGHSLLILDGEEIGCHGAKSAFAAIGEELNKEHQFAVEFDRMGAHDFKCYYVGSDAFRSYVAEQTGYTEPNRSSFSDICWISDPMCGVNLSVGYYHEHTQGEYLVISEWLNTLHVAKKWLSAQDLPRFERDKTEVAPVKKSFNLPSNYNKETADLQNKIHTATKKASPNYSSTVLNKISGVVESGEFAKVVKVAEVLKFYDKLGYLDGDKTNESIVNYKEIGLKASETDAILDTLFLEILNDYLSILDFYNHARSNFKKIDLIRKLRKTPTALQSSLTALLYTPGVEFYELGSFDLPGKLYLVVPDRINTNMFIIYAK